jgi:hypothetical protein
LAAATAHQPTVIGGGGVAFGSTAAFTIMHNIFTFVYTFL